MSTLSGPVPRGLRVAFVVLTVVAIALAVFAGFRGVWFLTAICAVFAVLNAGVLWTTRPATADRPAAGNLDAARLDGGNLDAARLDTAHRRPDQRSDSAAD